VKERLTRGDGTNGNSLNTFLTPTRRTTEPMWAFHTGSIEVIKVVQADVLRTHKSSLFTVAVLATHGINR